MRYLAGVPISPTKTQAAVPDETLAHAELRAPGVPRTAVRRLGRGTPADRRMYQAAVALMSLVSRTRSRATPAPALGKRGAAERVDIKAELIAAPARLHTPLSCHTCCMRLLTDGCGRSFGLRSDHRIGAPALRTEETTSRTAWVVAAAYFFSKISDACLAPSMVRWELLVDNAASFSCAALCGVSFRAGGEDDQRLVAEVGVLGTIGGLAPAATRSVVDADPRIAGYSGRNSPLDG